MALTKIEAFIFGGNRAHFVTALTSANSQITVTVVPVEDEPLSGTAEITATFPAAVVLSIWEDPAEKSEWPLDIIGFDSYPVGNRWKFVLNCDTIEWVWESAWPVLSSVQR